MSQTPRNKMLTRMEEVRAQVAERDELIEIIAIALQVMRAGVAAVIFDVVLTMAGQIIGRKRAVPIVTLAGAFIASWFFDVHILLILLACALIGLAQWRSDTKKGAAA